MSGTVTGGQLCAAKNKQKYGKDYYRRIGAMGGKAVHTKPRGFAANPELAREAGRIGGLISRRGPSLKRKEKNNE